jgi:hypothetical protein
MKLVFLGRIRNVDKALRAALDELHDKHRVWRPVVQPGAFQETRASLCSESVGSATSLPQACNMYQ